MRLNPPKKTTFWASIIIAVIGFIVFFLPYLVKLSWLGLIGFLLVVVAYILLVLGLTLKGL
jgi:hypothetical protein